MNTPICGQAYGKRVQEDANLLSCGVGNDPRHLTLIKITFVVCERIFNDNCKVLAEMEQVRLDDWGARVMDDLSTKATSTLDGVRQMCCPREMQQGHIPEILRR